MFKPSVLLFAAQFMILSSVGLETAHAQDSNGPSPLSYLDTSGFTYNILVDGTLSADNPQPIST